MTVKQTKEKSHSALKKGTIIHITPVVYKTKLLSSNVLRVYSLMACAAYEIDSMYRMAFIYYYGRAYEYLVCIL